MWLGSPTNRTKPHDTIPIFSQVVATSEPPPFTIQNRPIIRGLKVREVMWEHLLWSTSDSSHTRFIQLETWTSWRGRNAIREQINWVCALIDSINWLEAILVACTNEYDMLLRHWFGLIHFTTVSYREDVFLIIVLPRSISWQKWGTGFFNTIKMCWIRLALYTSGILSFWPSS